MTRFVVLCLLCMCAPAFGFETKGTTAFIVDQTTGMVLYEKNADTPLPPASMSKLMTLNMLFEALTDGRITLDTEFRISSEASKKGGSRMFLRDGGLVRVEDLIRGIIVHSGNDASIVVAENLAGSEASFAEAMTKRAQQLGMTKSTFSNATGWPDPNQLMSARDLVFLADRLITEFPQFYPYFAETSFTWEDITQENRNPILGRVSGADGLKTGHTSEAGYGLVGSAMQGDRRVIFMISGLQERADRAQEGERIVNWAFRQFIEKSLVPAGVKIAEADVWMGRAPRVGLVTGDNLVQGLVPALTPDAVSYEISYRGPIDAPISAGDPIAELVISIDELGEIRTPLYADADVSRGGIFKRIKTSAQKLGQTYLGFAPQGS